MNGCWVLEVNLSAAVTVLTDRPTPHKQTAGLKLVEHQQMLVLQDEPEREDLRPLWRRSFAALVVIHSCSMPTKYESSIAIVQRYHSPFSKIENKLRKHFYRSVAVFGISAQPCISQKQRAKVL